MSKPDAIINAAVLIPVYRDREDRLRLVLIRRNPDIVHGGELSFPGGKYDPDDNSFLAAALREAQEEIGQPPDRVRILAGLAPVETQATGFRIHPFLGAIEPVPWKIAHDEVAEVIDHDLAALADPGLHGEEMIHCDGWPQPRLTAFLRIGDRKLWGASLRIFQPLLPRILAGEFQI